MDLYDALSQIAEIRSRVARAQVFRGYRAATTLCTAVVAMGTALVQQLYFPNPARHAEAFLMLWCAAAILSLIVVGAGIAMRSAVTQSLAQRGLTRSAIEQFVPSLAIGLALTVVLAKV